MVRGIRVAALPLVVLAVASCSTDTSRLSAEQQQRFEAEHLLRRADNIVFRYTHDAGTAEAGWENRLASIVVTSQSVLVHKNEKVGVAIDPASTRWYEVHRDGVRVRINAGSGKERETWSFTPPDDADGWTRDIRAVIRASKSAANR